MGGSRIKFPDHVIAVDRPGYRGRRFTTEQTELRIRQETKEREAKLARRDRRHAHLSQDPALDMELKKAVNIMSVRDSLLRELAIRENISQDLCPDSGGPTYEEVKLTFEKVKGEVVETLSSFA